MTGDDDAVRIAKEDGISLNSDEGEDESESTS